jgi:large subunit ribosomal protein L9
MAKTEVVLIHNLVGLGAESDQVKVAAGYARNYLFPQGLAIPMTAANKRRLEVLRQRRAEREAHELSSMTELGASIAKMIIKIAVRTGADGKMFGAVTAGTIADELKHQCDISLDKRKIHLEQPIRALGDHEVELRLHPTVTAALKVKVESTTPLEVPVGAPPQGHAPPAPAEAKPGGPAREGRGPREGRAPADKGAAGKTARPRRPEGKAARPRQEKADPEREAAKAESAPAAPVQPPV